MQSGLKCKDFYAGFSFAQVLQYLAIVCSARTSYVIRTQQGLISGISKGFQENNDFLLSLFIFLWLCFFPFHKLHELTRALVACARVFQFQILGGFYQNLGTESSELDWDLEDGRPRPLGKSLDPAQNISIAVFHRCIIALHFT